MILAALRTAWGFAKLVPWQIYALAAAVFSFYSYGLYEHHQGAKDTAAKYDKQIAEEKAVRIAAQKKSDDLAQAKLDAAHGASVQAQLDANEALAAAEAKRLSDLADLRKRIPAYVSTLAIPAGDAPRGYVLWRSAAAAFANGANFAAPPGPAEGPLNGPSGVSFATLAETDAAQADAFRAATEWGRGWQTYARDLKTACQSQLDILTTKGSP